MNDHERRLVQAFVTPASQSEVSSARVTDTCSRMGDDATFSKSDVAENG